MVDSEIIFKQNRMIISLLGRLTFPEDKLKKIITTKSKKPKQLIKAYNLCDGTLTIPKISSKIEGVTTRALQDAIVKWEENGIILNIAKKGQGITTIPFHLYKIGE